MPFNLHHGLAAILISSVSVFSAEELLPQTHVVAARAILPWQPHDLTFTASQEHSWWEFPVRVAFTLEGDAKPALTLEGCWNGGKQWLVRVALPSAGRWRWRAEFTDAGLNEKSGELEVRTPDAEQLAANSNLRGQLRIAASGHYFEHADGTPFFLLASTLWAGNTARCGLGANQDGPFFEHLADRKKKGFTAILMQYFHGYGDYPDAPGHRNEGGKPYRHIATKELNAEFFQSLDTRMQALWQEGFVAAIPVTWWGKTKHCVFTPEDARRMSVYCAVRYGAFNALWCLSGEYQYAFKDCGWTPTDFTALGEEVQRHNPLHHPLSIHPSGQITWPPPHNVLSSMPFHGESWLDHHWLQTGQGQDRLFNIVTRLADNRALKPAMPIFCSESLYERANDAERAYLTRWQVWTAFLNGAAGYGYGAEGLWQFFDPNDPKGETGKKTGREAPWREAQSFEGSTQVIHARNLLTSLEWWKLVPARDRLRVDGEPHALPTKTDLTPPQAAVIGDKAWIVYVPRGNEGKAMSLQAKGNDDWKLHWINPRTGKQAPAVQVAGKNGMLDLPNRPAPPSEDWVGLFADAASEFIKRHAQEPWFVYLPFNAAHFIGAHNVAPGEKVEWQAPAATLARYGCKSDEPDQRKRFLALLTALDDAVGRVLDTVDDLKLRERTLVMFISDNGAFMLPGRGLKVQSNLPLRSDGVTTCEGGVRIPALFRWPGHLQAGAVNRTMLSSLDIVPLAIGVAGGALPKDRVSDGFDPLPALKGEAPSPHRALHWTWNRSSKEQWRGMREGDLKLLRASDQAPWQLYDLATDIGEKNYLAASQPDKFKELIQHFEQWRADIAADSTRSQSLRTRSSK